MFHLRPLIEKYIRYLDFSRQVDDLTKENQTLQRKISFYKELLEKGDKSEKIRELNEQIVSLKIKLSVSHLEVLLRTHL